MLPTMVMPGATNSLEIGSVPAARNYVSARPGGRFGASGKGGAMPHIAGTGVRGARGVRARAWG